jgi:hypothetical protein
VETAAIIHEIDNLPEYKRMFIVRIFMNQGEIRLVNFDPALGAGRRNHIR